MFPVSAITVGAGIVHISCGVWRGFMEYFFFFLVVEILGLWVSMHSGFWELTSTCFPKAIKLIYISSGEVSELWLLLIPSNIFYYLPFDFFGQICLLFKIVKWTLLSVLHLCGSQGLEVSSHLIRFKEHRHWKCVTYRKANIIHKTLQICRLLIKDDKKVRIVVRHIQEFKNQDGKWGWDIREKCQNLWNWLEF